MSAASPINRVIDDAERNGKLNLRTEEIAKALPNVSEAGLRLALYRLQKKGRIARTSRGAGHWVIIPLQNAISGAPPLESWLNAYITKTLGLSYYVGLLSAAEIYGASPYAVTVTQIFVPRPRRPLQVGRHQLNFISRSNIGDIPVQWHDTPDGRFRVSTPEATALDLVQRQQMIGGPGRLAAVMQPLAEVCTAQGLVQALDAIQEIPSAQRLGALLSKEGFVELAHVTEEWLANKRTRPLPFTNGQDNSSVTLDPTFKVLFPDQLQPANA